MRNYRHIKKQKTFPSFFQSDTIGGHKKQVRWLMKHLGLKHEFFAKVIDDTAFIIKDWLAGKAELYLIQERRLGRLWQMFLRMFSLMNYDCFRVKTLIEAKSASIVHPALRLPWSGQSIKYYLENGGSKAIDNVNRWLISFRFG